MIIDKLNDQSKISHALFISKWFVSLVILPFVILSLSKIDEIFGENPVIRRENFLIKNKPQSIHFNRF